MDVRTKRIYEEPAAEDGLRVLVDRVWPRGVSRERARLDEWEPELAPSPELRTWFVTLLYAARDRRRNNAFVLAEALRRDLSAPEAAVPAVRARASEASA